ncbi:Rhodanese Homology Domain [Rhizoctonia solani]|uniref:M-phase inducer phosphatase n=1 Tax=Rhizoctonia solani TaxID=456999 RepID=A0A8H7IKN2_9AGAM|nr:Rhodanese Homology Domain [Rhizoctonia solani]
MASTFFSTTSDSAFATRPRSSTTKTLTDAPFLTEAEDLEMSFASTMSLSSAPNSPPTHSSDFPSGTHFLIPHQQHKNPSSPVPMDISPAPRRIASTLRYTPSDRASTTKGLTGSALVKELLRSFGQDVANTSHNSATNSSTSTVRDIPRNNKTPVSASVKSNSSRSRGTLPMGWMQQSETISSRLDSKSSESSRPHPVRNRSQTVDFTHVNEETHHSTASVAWDNVVTCDAMDIDGDVSLAHSATAPSSPRIPEFDPEEEIAHQEQRAADLVASSPDKPALFSSSPPVSPSSRPVRPGPGVGLGRPFERSVTTGGQGSLFQTLAAGQALPKRGNAFASRRPVVLQNDAATSSTGSLLSTRPGQLQPSRRAFSASITSSALVMGNPILDNLGSDDSHCDDGSPARAYATRKAAGPPMRRLAPPQNERAKQSSPSPGLLDDLLAGKFDSQINSYTVIDCRFDYEYAGGHIPGAINLNTTQAIEDYLLGDNKPAPNRSGDGTKKDVLVFHCEFSAKRAPTFAKHLRSRDRALNSHSYPNVHYPEVYIMAGGFNQYFKEKPSQVEPPFSYVQMDDPVHLRARHSDLNNFRRWERTKSYTYGEKQAAAAALASGKAHMKHSSAPADTGNSQAPSRMNGGTSNLSTLDENDDSIYSHEDDLSPCPPSGAANYLRLAGKSRGALERANSFGFAMTKR